MVLQIRRGQVAAIKVSTLVRSIFINLATPTDFTVPTPLIFRFLQFNDAEHLAAKLA
jgi:hypothetical protein